MEITGWGNYPVIQADGFSFETTDQLNHFLKKTDTCIAYGMGRSYGDSALNHRVVFSRRLDKILDFDSKQGVVTCESGVTLADIINTYLPGGWFLTVTPGTKFITAGGAVASDVHGKNHHKAGCFCESVICFDIMLPDGSIVACNRENNPDLFRATCGGMGLTGIILTVTLKLQPVKSSNIRETIMRCQNLDVVFDLFERYESTTYSVAWIDCQAKGENIGRSVLMVGEHADSGNLAPPAVKPSISIPFNFPGFCLNRYSISVFNHLYFRKNPGYESGRIVSLDTFFYPLDAIDMWNRIYGKNGFTQYQLVLPKAASLKGLRAILEKIASAGMGSFLAVLKLFGRENDNYLSFPMEGYTLALDFKMQPGLFPFLDILDAIVLDHGGRLYLTKDVRMKRDVFINGYPRWKEFERLRTQEHMKDKFNSLQSIRLEI